MDNSPGKIGILFVCMGNICRSPAAEGVFRHYVKQSGHDGLIYIDSAGTIGYHEGSPPDIRMQQAATMRGYRLDSVARRVRPADLETFDLTVAMDHDNLSELLNLVPGAEHSLRLLGSFLTAETAPANIPPVPDPYYGGDEGFEKVLDMMESACPLMLDHCLELADRRKG